MCLSTCCSPAFILEMCQQGSQCWPWLGEWAEPSLKALLSLGFAQTQALPLIGKEGQGEFISFLCPSVG